jgi:hypothetical protein
MRDQKRMAAMFAVLAHNFNDLLGIKPGHFGHARKSHKPTPANLRAADLVRRRREAHANRLAGKPYEAGL